MPLLFWISFTVSGGWAVTVPPEALRHQLEAAQLVADIHVETLEATADPVLHARFLAQATVRAVVRNSTRPVREGQRIAITGPGGETGSAGTYYSGYPRPHSGRNYRAWLRQTEGGAYVITGYDFGLRSESSVRSPSRNRTDGSNGDGEGAFLRWDETFLPLTYSISYKSFTGHSDFLPAIDTSFKTWRDPGGSVIEFTPLGCTTVDGNFNDGINAVVLVASGWPFDASAIAVTRNFYISDDSARAGMILDSDILLNGENYSFTTSAEPGKHDIRNILTHEIGHFLGFGHEVPPEDSDATMYAVASPGETNKQILHKSEQAILQATYGGAATKTGMSGYTCRLPSEPLLGCAASHGTGSPWSLFPLVGMGCVVLVTGWVRRRSRETTSTL